MTAPLSEGSDTWEPQAQLTSPKPAPPIVDDNGDQTLTVKWHPDPDALSYRIYRDIHDGAVNPQPIESGVTGTSWRDPELLEVGSKHTYRIQVVYADTISDISDKSEAAEVSRATQ
jgi:hypothetical protein